MDVVESLPAGPLTERHVFMLNDADALELAVPVRLPGDAGGSAEDEHPAVDERSDTDERAHGLLVATDDWLTALAFDGQAWQVVETYDLGEQARIDAMQAGEESVEAFLSA